ncbi:MAG TPA: DUF6249 domain-containing protein [Steroidobacter sp.]|jgi:hypothetical protein|nr:DUF6249 domain-containing protein [Steroidobacter sp.]
MPEELIPLAAIVFSLSIPLVAIVLNYRKRRRLMDLHHTERMAAIERGMDIPPLPMELIAGRSPRRRTSLLPGLVWFFVGIAVAGGMLLERDGHVPWMIGLVPLAIGLAYLIYYFAEGRKLESRMLEHELGQFEHRRTATQSGASL